MNKDHGIYTSCIFVTWWPFELRFWGKTTLFWNIAEEFRFHNCLKSSCGRSYDNGQLSQTRTRIKKDNIPPIRCQEEGKEKCGIIYKNLLTLKKGTASYIIDTSIYHAAMTRSGWYRQYGMSVVTIFFSFQLLAMPKLKRTDKAKSRPGLVDPYALYQSLRILLICM